MQLGAIDKKVKKFHYHLNGRHIHDNACAIEIGLKQRSQNTVYAFLNQKCH